MITDERVIDNSGVSSSLSSQLLHEVQNLIKTSNNQENKIIELENKVNQLKVLALALFCFSIVVTVICASLI